MLRNSALCSVIAVVFGIFIPFLAKQPVRPTGIELGVKEIPRKPENNREVCG